MTDQWADDLNLALALADEADAITSRNFRRACEAKTKTDGSFVTDIDLEIETRLKALLRTHRPSDHMLGEEYGLACGGDLSSSRMWIIDPLDQTTHFLRGNPNYGTLIALSVGGTAQLGVVSAPSLGRRWWGIRGVGAWENGLPITVSATTSVSAAHIALAGLREWVDFYDWSALRALTSRCTYPCGTAGGFLPAMLVAAGQLDAFAEPWGSHWDHAASAAIVSAAGGRASTLTGAPASGGSFLVSNGIIHVELLTSFRRVHPAES